MKQLSVVDAAYIAGLLDGEGHIGLIRIHNNDVYRQNSYVLKIEITNNCMEILEWLQSVTGIGCIYKKNHATSWAWTLAHSTRCKAFLPQIISFLRIKQEQAKVALEFCQTVISDRKGQKYRSDEPIAKRDKLRERMLALNGRYRSFIYKPTGQNEFSKINRRE